ncbi:MAG: hypothetical protein CVV07_00365 [Gammaproteobacteria bacterium HGW-Gammaproteobacteria-11]|nr:MAG: hypothetical protein CVV07_00365 [Gammaproteobacteria bacterium HGW-Gammaproteobacteria-11]
MALINCSECGNQISDQAVSCPGCGAPISQGLKAQTAMAYNAPKTEERKVGILLGLGIFIVPFIFVWFLLRNGHTPLARIVGFGWFGLAVLIAMGGDQDRTQSTSTSNSTSSAASQRESSRLSQIATPAAPAEPVVLREVTAQQLAAAYERNTVAADQQFKGKRFKVTGVVDSINTNFLGRPYITLRGSTNRFMQPQFELERNQTSYAARLSEGMRVTLACTGSGDVAKIPMSDECVPAI